MGTYILKDSLLRFNNRYITKRHKLPTTYFKDLYCSNPCWYCSCFQSWYRVYRQNIFVCSQRCGTAYCWSTVWSFYSSDKVCHERPLTRYIEQKVFESIQTARSLMLISNHFPMRLFAFEIKGSLLSFVMISVHYSFNVSLFYLLRGINKPLID